MIKKSIKSNTLIKRKNILEFAKKNNIRLSKESIDEIEFSIKKYLEDISSISKENAVIHGRRTIKKEDIKEAVRKLSQKKQADWEI